MTQAVIEFTEQTVIAEVNEVTGFVELTPTPTQVARTIETEGYVEFYQQGPQGPQGPAGASYVYTQSAPAATWTITHNLNTVLSVVLLTDALPGIPQITDVSYPDLNTVVVEWPSPETGKAYLR